MSDEIVRATKRDIEIAELGRRDGLVTHTTEHARALVSAIESLTAERDRLAAELAKLRAQVPAEQSLATIQDSHQPAVPDGYVLVPKFPTEKMLMEGCDAMEENHQTSNFGLCFGCGWAEVSAAYAAMLAAAQKGE